MSIPQIPELGKILKKSDTHSFALPNISKVKSKMPHYKTSRVSQHKSVFMEKVKGLTQDTRYEDMEMSNISQEQKKLKGLLREFNNETYNILGNYIQKPVNQSSKKSRTTSIVMRSQVKDKQIMNSQDILEICKTQLNLLQKRSESLKFMTTEDIERKISDIKDKIQQTKMVNKQITKGNTLRALGLKKDDERTYHGVSDLEQQKYVHDLKKQRLTSDLQYIKQQQKSLADKNNEADKKIGQLSLQFDKILVIQNEKSEQQQIKTKLASKKQMLDRNKKQVESGSLTAVIRNNRHEGHYLGLLRSLQQFKKSGEKADSDIRQVQGRIEQTKRDLLISEHRLSLIKKGMTDGKVLDKVIEEAKQKEGCNTQ